MASCRVDMGDTAIVGHRNFAIEHDLACLPGHVVNRSEPGPSPPISPALLTMVAERNELHPAPRNYRGGDRWIRRKEAEPGAQKPVPLSAIAALSRRRGSKSARADEA